MMQNVSKVTVGSDVLEILSIAMYADPLVVYRELIQNSADAIDLAIRAGILGPRDGKISVSFDASTRTASLTDNGFGLSNEQFDDQMLALGASAKRVGTFRGFRGIGRLAGLGHCRKLVFRSRAKGDRFVSEAAWDGLKVRDAVRKTDIVPLERITREAVQLSRMRAGDEPEHFFEVRLEGLRRLPDDRLFDALKVSDYLSQVAPLPFSPRFSFAEYITKELTRRTPLLEVALLVGNNQIFKPYEDRVAVRKDRYTTVSDIEFIELPSTDDQVAAFGWLAHTDYLGALRPGYGGRGLRVRSGNLQVGDADLLARAFPEERFNSWSIGEFHVFDARLRPNARRDAFEPGIAVDDLFNQLSPHGHAIAKRCRLASKRRQLLKRLEALSRFEADLEAHLHRNTSPLANSVRQFISDHLTAQLSELQERSTAIGDTETFSAVAEVKERATRAMRKRGTNPRKPSQRHAGQLDVIRLLYSSGQEHLVGRMVTELTRLRP